MEDRASRREVVAVDIGGTHARFAIATLHGSRVVALDHVEKLMTSDYAGLEEAWEAYRRHAMHGFMWPFTPLEMQPIEIVTAEGDCFGAAVSDLDTFGALGV